jgi:hypothetical protein
MPLKQTKESASWTVEGVGNTKAVVLIAMHRAPKSVRLDQISLDGYEFDANEHLLRIRFSNEARPRELMVQF